MPGAQVRWRTVAKDFARGSWWWLSPGGRRADKARLARCRDARDLLAMSASLGHGAQQLEQEILPFLEWVERLAPLRICEIGTAAGSTNFLLAHGLASVKEIIGVDLFVKNRIQLRALASPGQSIHLVDGSSYDAETIARVERILDGNKLDVLFIDGDHRYSGVSRDFLGYRQFVRTGGLIAFHDIQPDGRERGLRSRQNSGDVPLLWRQLRPAFEHREFIGSSDQRGFGIGVLIERSDATLPPELNIVAPNEPSAAGESG